METRERLYRVAVNGGEIGEYSMADLKEFWRSGGLDRAAVYFHEGIGQWRPVAPLIGPNEGRLQAGATETKKKAGAWRVFAVAAVATLALVLVLGIAVPVMRNKAPKTEREMRELVTVELVSDAKKRIAAVQKAPSTTKWLNVRTGWEGDVLTVEHEYDSQNGFGAMLRGFGTVRYTVDLKTHHIVFSDVDLRWGPPITAGM